MSNQLTIPSTEELNARRREVLIDERDELRAQVKTRKQELKAAIERWHRQGRGSTRAMFQVIDVINRGEHRISLIDLELESLRSEK
jgi:hypothetical protein